MVGLNPSVADDFAHRRSQQIQAIARPVRAGRQIFDIKKRPDHMAAGFFQPAAGFARASNGRGRVLKDADRT